MRLDLHHAGDTPITDVLGVNVVVIIVNVHIIACTYITLFSFFLPCFSFTRYFFPTDLTETLKNILVLIHAVLISIIMSIKWVKCILFC